MIAQFDLLPVEDKQALAKEILRHLSPYDSGALDDNIVALAGDQVASMLDEEENGSSAR